MDDILKINHKDVILRDRSLKDIDDYVRWYTTDTEWQDWDAPWENDEALDIEDIKKDMIEAIKKPLSEVRSRFEICYKDETHIGWMNSYHINGNKKMLAVGIDIPNRNYRGKGLGESALSGFILYLSNSNVEEVYTETWSGNDRMIKIALKLGFEEFEREKDFTIVNGKKYDRIIFKLNRNIFLNKYGEQIK